MPTSTEQTQARGEYFRQAYQNNPRFLPEVSDNLQNIRSRLKLMSTNLQMGSGYDYNRFIPDPDEVFNEAANNFTVVANQFRHDGDQAEQDEKPFDGYEGYLREAVASMVHASNALENAGVNLDITRSLVEDILSGERLYGDIREEEDVRYQAIEDHLAQKKVLVYNGEAEKAYQLAALKWTMDYGEVQQAYRQVAHHVYALFYLIDHMVLRDKPLSEGLLKHAHRTLTDGIDAENLERDPPNTYGGVYRTDDVGWTPFSSFVSPTLIPRCMASTITEFNNYIQKSEGESTEAIDPYQLAAEFSHKILNVHPFLDGNSRISRILLNTVLLKYTGTMIPFGRDPIELVKWKETVARALEMEGEVEVLGEDDHAPWKEVATLILIQGGKEMGRLKGRVLGQPKVNENAEEGYRYPWEGEMEKNDPFVREMVKRMGWKGWDEESTEDQTS